MVFTCGTLPKSQILEYNRGSSSNGQALLFWWHLFTFYTIITFSSGVLSVIYSVLSSVCCLVKKLVPVFMNLPSMCLNRLSRVRYYYCNIILRIYMADRHLPASLRALARLVRYSMLKVSAWFFVIFLT